MKFKKGDKVEVLSQKELPSGFWRCAEIICGNGHDYTVRFDGYMSGTNKTVLERIPRNAVRPCPLLKVSEHWVPGDIVEVFDNLCWKMATVTKVLGTMYFLVRLIGSRMEFKVSKFDIRVRQSWQDDKWVVIGEGSGICEDGKRNRNVTLKKYPSSSFQAKKTNTSINLHARKDSLPAKNKVNIQEESHIASSRTLKRASPDCCSRVEGCTGAAEKFRAVEKEGRLYRLIAINPSLLPEPIDAAAFPREMFGETYIHPYTDAGTAERRKPTDAAAFPREMLGETYIHPYTDAGTAERRKPTDAVGCSLAVNFVSDDAESVACSVGSCSVSSNNSFRLPHHVSAGPLEDSDAESFGQLGYEEGNFLLRTQDELAAEIHRLELHAYRCTMEALHASGPLSWEQEAMVTNLRLSLHISNDEHLTELRNLISADNSIPIR